MVVLVKWEEQGNASTTTKEGGGFPLETKGAWGPKPLMFSVKVVLQFHFWVEWVLQNSETLKETSWAKGGARTRVLDGCHVCKGGEPNYGWSGHAFIHAFFLPSSENGNVIFKLLANYN